MKTKRFLLLLSSFLATALLVAGCTQKIDTDILDVETNLDVNISTDKTDEETEETKSEEVSEEVVEEKIEEEETACELEDGVYIAEFNTDSSMFHANEMCEGKGELTVKDGQMTIHVSLVSKSIVNLYYGLAEDAQKDGAVLLEPTVDTIDYNDGTTDEVFGFDIPVPYLDDEFDVALIGKKGVWYDHKVSVTNPVLKDSAETVDDASEVISVAEGDYTIDVDLEGGSGKATITSPASVKVGADGENIAVIEWSSPNYDYMIVDGEKYLPVNEEGNSVFEIPVKNFDEPLEVIADTVAMSKPHEIEYTLIFHSDTMKEVE